MSEAIDPGVPVLDAGELEETIQEEGSVVVLYYADWCPFSQAFAGVFRDRVDEVGLPVFAANLLDPEGSRWAEYGIETIPTVVHYEDGEEGSRAEATAGEGLSEKEYEAFLDTLPA